MAIVDVLRGMIMNRVTYAVLLLSFLLPAAAPAYEPQGPPPLTSQVVDAETGRPIEGAVVLAYWTKCYPSFGGWAGCEFSDAEETVTGPDGRYSIRKRLTYEIPLIIQVNGPNFVFYKAGYGLPQRRLQGDTEVIALPPLKTREERLKALGRIHSPSVVPQEYTRRLDEGIQKERAYLGLK